jgi:hypothetical protein
MSDWRTRKGANLEKPSFDDECRISSALARGVSKQLCVLVISFPRSLRAEEALTTDN